MLNSSENWPAFFNASNLLLSNWWEFIEKIVWIFILFSCSSFLTLSFFVLLFFLIIAALCCSTLPATSSWWQFYTTHFFLPCFLYFYMFYFYLCFYSDMHPTVAWLTTRRLTASLLSLSVRWALLCWCSSPVLCLIVVHPSCFFATFGSFNPFTFNFGSHFL